MRLLSVEEAEVASAINELKLSYAARPNQIPSTVISNCRDALTPILTFIITGLLLDVSSTQKNWTEKGPKLSGNFHMLLGKQDVRNCCVSTFTTGL